MSPEISSSKKARLRIRPESADSAQPLVSQRADQPDTGVEMITAVQNTGTGSPRRIRKAVVAPIGATALAPAGCAADTGAEPDTDAPADLTRMVVVSFLPLQSFTFTPEMYAYSSGIFEEHGLD